MKTASATHQRMNKINSDIERLLHEKENLKQKLNDDLVAIFQKMNFNDFDYDTVIVALKYIKHTLEKNDDASKEEIQKWKSNSRAKVKAKIKETSKIKK